MQFQIKSQHRFIIKMDYEVNKEINCKVHMEMQMSKKKKRDKLGERTVRELITKHQ